MCKDHYAGPEPRIVTANLTMSAIKQYIQSIWDDFSGQQPVM
jgi:hypothetical protein